MILGIKKSWLKKGKEVERTPDLWPDRMVNWWYVKLCTGHTTQVQWHWESLRPDSETADIYLVGSVLYRLQGWSLPSCSNKTEHTRTRTGYKVLSLDICCYAMWHTVAERSSMKEQVSRKVVVKWRSSMREVAWRTSETQGEMRKVQGLSSNTTTSSECVKKNTGDWYSTLNDSIKWLNKWLDWMT